MKVGLASGALASSAVCVKVEMGLPRSEVLSTLPKPTIALVIPVTVPVKVGLARGALALSAVCVKVGVGLLASVVLSTLPRPTIALVMPATVPVKVGLFFETFDFTLISTVFTLEPILYRKIYIYTNTLRYHVLAIYINATKPTSCLS